MRVIPEKYRPLVIALAIIGAVGLVSFAFDVFDIGEEGMKDCCATEFDPTPYQQVPAGTAP